MESKTLRTNSQRRKVYIVYYLSRGVQVDQPHLIEGHLPPSQDYLRLKDVKRWLAVLRGRGMPNSFAWSYRKTYSGGYIWHDVCDADVILPLCQFNEYFLMGSEIRDFCEDNCTNCRFGRETFSIKVEDFKKTKEPIYDGLVKSTPKRPEMRPENRGNDDNQFGPSPCVHSARKFCEVHTRPPKCWTQNDMAANISADCSSPVKSDGVVLNQARVYKARPLALTSDQGTDVGTQTGESKRSSTEDVFIPLHLSHATVSESPFLDSVASHNDQTNGMFSGLSTISTPNLSTALGSPDSESSKPKKSVKLNFEDSKTTRKQKNLVSSQIFRQLLCGSVDIDETTVFNLKSMPIHPGTTITHQCARLQSNLAKSWPLTPCGGSQELKSVSCVSHCSRDIHGCSPSDSTIQRSNMVTSSPIGSSSPGVLSLCSSSPKRSLDIETKKGRKGDLSTSPRRSLQFEYCGSTDLTRQVLKSPANSRSPRISVSDNIAIISKNAKGGSGESKVAAAGEVAQREVKRAPNWREILWSPKKDGLKREKRHS
eukprot:c21655_g1_i1 orf=82-1701(-)